MKKLVYIFFLLCYIFVSKESAFGQVVKPDYVRTPNGPNTIVDWNVKFKTMILPHYLLGNRPTTQDTIGQIFLNTDTTDQHIYIRGLDGSYHAIANMADVSGGGLIPTNGTQAISPDSIGLGGRLTQSTSIDLNGNDITFSGINSFLNFSDGGFSAHIGDTTGAFSLIRSKASSIYMNVQTPSGKQFVFTVDTTAGYLLRDDKFNKGIIGSQRFNVVNGWEYMQKLAVDSIAKAKADSVVSAHPSTPYTANGGIGLSSNNFALASGTLNSNITWSNTTHSFVINSVGGTNSGVLTTGATTSIMSNANATQNYTVTTKATGLSNVLGAYIGYNNVGSTNFAGIRINKDSVTVADAIHNAPLYYVTHPNFTGHSRNIPDVITVDSLISNGATSKVDTGKIIVFFAFGQSNMQGQGATYSAYIPDPNLAKSYYNHQLVALKDPVGISTHGSLFPAFTVRWLQLNPGEKICIVTFTKGTTAQSYIGDTGPGNWDDPSHGGTLYATAVATANEALDSLTSWHYKPKIGGILWLQGEQDGIEINASVETVAQYKAAYIAMILRFQSAFPNVPFYDFNIGAKHSATDAGWQAVRATKQFVADSLSNVKILYNGARDFYLRGLQQSQSGSYLHYSTAGYDEAGTKGAEAIVNGGNIREPYLLNKPDLVTGSIYRAQFWADTKNNLPMGDSVSLVSNTASNQLNIQNGLYGINNAGQNTTLSNGAFGVYVQSPTAMWDIKGSIAGQASLRLRNGVAVTSPNDGEFWNDGTHLYAYIGGAARQLDQQVAGFATPTAQVGLTAIAGSATTYMRSDAAPALNTSPAYTWAALQTFSVGTQSNTFSRTTGNYSSPYWGVNGASLRVDSRTITDNSTTDGATQTNTAISAFGIPTVNAANSSTGITYTNLSNVYIAGAPIVTGTNAAVTNAYALNVNAGLSRFGSLTASQTVETAADKSLVSVAFTGTGNYVKSTSPTLVTPTIGVATATSINKVAITAPAASATLTIANGTTLSTLNSFVLDKAALATLASGTVAITVTGVTTASICTVTEQSGSGNSLTVRYKAVCTANTITISALLANDTLNTADNSIVNYIAVN